MKAQQHNENIQSHVSPAEVPPISLEASLAQGRTSEILPVERSQDGISRAAGLIASSTGLLPWFIASPNPDVYLSDNYLVLDFETTNLEKGSTLNKQNRIILATWAGADGVVHYKWGNQYEQQELLSAVAQADFICAHNAKFELQWLEECGLDISKVLVYDTLLGDYVLAGNRSWGLDLDSCAERYGQVKKNNLIKLMMNAGICPSQMPRDLLLKYGKGDTSTTREIFLKQRQVLKESNLLPVLYTRCLTTNVLASIEKNGMQLDEERVTKEYNRVVKALAELDAALHRITGGINPNSPKQLGEFVYDKLGFKELTSHRGEVVRTDAGGRKTDADTLSQLVEDSGGQTEYLTENNLDGLAVRHEFKEVILKRQEENTKLKTLVKMKACCDEDGGILYARFNQSITQTHRLSSAGARHKLQFQNFHRPYKILFRARNESWSIGEADGASLEVRVAGHLTRDEQIKSDIISKFDFHKATGASFLNKPVPKVTKHERQEYKPETFRPLYGSNGSTPAQKRYASYFHDRYKATYETQRGWTYSVLADKRLVTEWGLIFYWPDVSMSSSGYIKNTTNIFNYPVQSFATAEIIPISLVYFWHRARALGLKLVVISTIHDSIIAEVPPYEKEIFNQLSVQSFTHDTYGYLQSVYGVTFTVPLGVETKIGKYWSEGEGITEDVPPPIHL